MNWLLTQREHAARLDKQEVAAHNRQHLLIHTTCHPSTLHEGKSFLANWPGGTALLHRKHATIRLITSPFFPSHPNPGRRLERQARPTPACSWPTTDTNVIPSTLAHEGSSGSFPAAEERPRSH